MKIFPVLESIVRRSFSLSLGGRSITGRKKAPAILAASLLIPALASCVNETMEPCAVAPNTFTTVNFVYDYNMLREDLFNQHAGTAHLYVFDQDSVFVFDNALSRTDMNGKNIDFSMTFDTTYLKPGNTYLMVAMAQGNHGGYEASLETPGFQIPLEHQMIPGVSKLSDYRIVLDRDSDTYVDFGVVNYRDEYGSSKQMMDTLWCTKPGEIQSVDIPYNEYQLQVEQFPDVYLDVTIPMMRLTNAVTVNLLHDSFTEDTNMDRFNVLVDFPNGNGTIGFTGDLLRKKELYYRALRKNVVKYQKKQSNADYDDSGSKAATRADDSNTYAIEAVFGLSRLQALDGSALQIRNGETNELLFQLGGSEDQSFSQWLANYFNTYYDDQEFLDREYTFTIDIHMNDNYVWDWYQIGCSILGWGKRVYNYVAQ